MQKIHSSVCRLEAKILPYFEDELQANTETRTDICSSSTWPEMIDDIYLKKTFQHFLRQLLFGRQDLTNFFNLYLAALTIDYQLLIGNIWNTFLLF